jgi:hypothetical protein
MSMFPIDSPTPNPDKSAVEAFEENLSCNNNGIELETAFPVSRNVLAVLCSPLLL